MKKINNLRKVINLLKFPSPDVFYILDIIQRKKEHVNLNSSNRIVKSYNIKSVEYLELHMHEIETMCNAFNARAYINLNSRSFKQCAFKSLSKLSEYLEAENYINVPNLHRKTIGKIKSKINSSFIIDIDSKDFESIDIMNIEIEKFYVHISEYKELLTKENIQPVIFKDEFPTPNGIHIIVEPFWIEEFKSFLRKKEFKYNFDIHKDNPTILYF